VQAILIFNTSTASPPSLQLNPQIRNFVMGSVSASASVRGAGETYRRIGDWACRRKLDAQERELPPWRNPPGFTVGRLPNRGQCQGGTTVSRPQAATALVTRTRLQTLSNFRPSFSPLPSVQIIFVPFCLTRFPFPPFVFFATFCSNGLRSLLFHPFPFPTFVLFATFCSNSLRSLLF
jgi:hypothetical protein